MTDWTHKEVKIVDIRKLHKLYVISVAGYDIIEGDDPIINVTISDRIFEERLESYFLRPTLNITREDILSVSWDMYITKSYYVKLATEVGNELFERFDQEPNKYYVSFLEISGELSNFDNILNKNKI